VPRRVSLPGADELFRTTGGAALQAPQPRQHPGGSGAEGQNGTQTDSRLRPVPDQADKDAADRADGGGEARPDRAGQGGDSAEHGGRDIPPSRRPLTAERGGMPPAAQSATMTTSAPAVQQSQGPSVQPPITAQPQPQAARRKAPRQNRRPSGRERHDEKITVYVSAEELMDLEHARLVLRGEHGLAIDRGRIVREAVAVVLADLESRGDASILVRRLRGR
jgi:hypothetical protein